MRLEWPRDYVNKVICGDCLEVMKEMPDKCVDLVLTDPPYNSKINYGIYKDNLDDDKYWKWMRQFISECERVGSTILIKHSALKIHDWSKNIGKGRMLVWYKPFSSGFPLNGVATHFEPIWWISGKSKKWSKDVFVASSGGGNIEPSMGHPAQFPEKLAFWLIDVFSVDGDVILDPLIGSGTTSRACKDAHRNFIGIEINPDYCTIAEERLSQGVL